MRSQFFRVIKNYSMLVDATWKIVVLSVLTSAIFSTLLTFALGRNPLIGFSIGSIMAFLISYPLGEILTRWLKKVRQINTELEEANRKLDEYAHTIAHNMRNTVASISMSNQLILMTVDNNSRAYRHAKKSDALVYELVATIDSLLLLASVRDEEVDYYDIDMRLIVDKAISRLEEQIAIYSPTIELPLEWITSVGYGPWLVELWMNLLSNAMKYGGTPSIILLGNELQSDGYVRYWIQDNGIGLTKEQQSKLFKKFSKLDRVDGHGLGLSIVYEITSKLGGTVGVESQGKECGSRFFFTLPTQSFEHVCENTPY